MKFNFSLRGRQSAESSYTFVKAGANGAHEDFFRNLLTAWLNHHPSGQSSEAMTTIRREIQLAEPGLIARVATGLSGTASLREVAFWLTAERAAVSGKDEDIGALVASVVRQPLDLPLWLDHFARVAGAGRKPGPAVRKHLAGVLHRLDEYKVARAGRETQAALREALRLLRPKTGQRMQKNLFARILRDQIPARSSWEQEWHALHQQHYDSPEQRQVVLRDKWKEGISSFRIGYPALLDNLRPMLCAGVSGKVLKLAAEYLGNATAVSRSGVATPRMLEAYRVLNRIEQGGVGMLSESLENAVLHSSWARTEFGSTGVSVIAMDVSNSMKRPISGAVESQRFDIAPLLAMVWKSRGSSVLAGIIGNTWRPLSLPARPVLMAMDGFRTHEGEAGYAINAHLVLQDLLRKRQVVDRVLIFTDCRLWDNRTFNQPAGTDLGHWWRQYRRELAPEARLYLFDLAGYGYRTLECLDDEVFLIAGWKEGIFDILDAAARDRELTGMVRDNG